MGASHRLGTSRDGFGPALMCDPQSQEATHDQTLDMAESAEDDR
jgi:hypothetical protein